MGVNCFKLFLAGSLKSTSYLYGRVDVPEDKMLKSLPEVKPKSCHAVTGVSSFLRTFLSNSSIMFENQHLRKREELARILVYHTLMKHKAEINIDRQKNTLLCIPIMFMASLWCSLHLKRILYICHKADRTYYSPISLPTNDSIRDSSCRPTNLSTTFPPLTARTDGTAVTYKKIVIAGE